MNWVFLGLTGIFFQTSFGLYHWEISRSSPAGPWKTLSKPSPLLRLIPTASEGSVKPPKAFSKRKHNTENQGGAKFFKIWSSGS